MGPSCGRVFHEPFRPKHSVPLLVMRGILSCFQLGGKSWEGCSRVSHPELRLRRYIRSILVSVAVSSEIFSVSFVSLGRTHPACGWNDSAGWHPRAPFAETLAASTSCCTWAFKIARG